MGALGHLSKGRHVAVGLVVLGTSALALFGVIGDGNPEEKVDSWQSIVEPGEAMPSASPRPSTGTSGTTAVTASSATSPMTSARRPT